LKIFLFTIFTGFITISYSISLKEFCALKDNRLSKQCIVKPTQINKMSKKEIKKSSIVQEDKKSFSKTRFFLSANFGTSQIDISNNIPNDQLNDNILDNKGSFYNLGFGYLYNEDLFTTLDYSLSKYGIFNINNFSSSFNYKLKGIFSDKTYYTYLGGVLGLSKFRFSKKPIQNSIMKTSSIVEPFYGLKFGLVKQINYRLYIIVNYDYLLTNHKIYLNQGISKIEYTNQNSISLGVHYAF